MKKIQSIVIIAAGLMLSSATAQETITKIDVSIFPKPEKGYKMMVIEVPHSDADHQKKLEFFAGKYIETDSCNRHSLQGTFEQKDLQGWGYNYYVLNTNEIVISTQMACPNNKTVYQFVTGPTQTITYNGKMPVVVYVPENIDVHFKIYESKTEEYKAATYQFKK